MATTNRIGCESINSSRFVNENNNHEMEGKSQLQKNPKKSTFQRSKCVPFKGSTPPDLERVHHQPIYELPILTNGKYRHLDVKQRADLMSDYLTKISNVRANLAKRSLLIAPQPKPILPSTKCTYSLIKTDMFEEIPQIEEFDENGESQPKELYVSRFGRQTKRKVYTEDVEIDNILETNTNHNGYEDSDLKITLSNVVDAEQPKDEALIKYYSALKGKKRLPRAERLFQNLLKQDEKRKEQEAELETFNRTLSQADEESHENHDNNINNGIEEDFHELNPPSLRRKIANTRKRKSIPVVQEDLDRIEAIPESPTKSDQIPQAKRSKEIKNRKKETECPICNIKFPANEVEEHASTCGEFMQEP